MAAFLFLIMKFRKTYIPYLVGVVYSVLFGIVAQFAFRLKVLEEFFAAMSFGFVFILPVVMGVITVWFAPNRDRVSWPYCIFVPWLSMLLSLLVSFLVGWEGTICLIMAIVVFLPMASLGGVLGKIILKSIQKRESRQFVLAVFLAIPFVSAGLESLFKLPVTQIQARNHIDIAAPVEEVWNNIIRVRKIDEPISGLFYKMGFPKPIEATLSREGVGGVRQASFENNLLFVETITEWQDKRLISFAIEVDPNHTPPTTLDSHVTVGGRYFDVLQGTYEIESINGNLTRLHLWSDFRVSTRFNFYASLWAELLMSDIQSSILDVIKRRCEL